MSVILQWLLITNQFSEVSVIWFPLVYLPGCQRREWFESSMHLLLPHSLSIKNYFLWRLTFICPAHISALSEEVVLTLMCARNTAFGVQKQLVSPGFLWVREVGGQYHTPLQEVCAESTEQWGFRLDSTGPAGSAAGIILSGQEIPGQSTPTGTSPCLSTPRPAAHREEIRINLRFNMLILTPPLPPFALHRKKRYCRVCFWKLRVVNTWKSRTWIMPCPRKWGHVQRSGLFQEWGWEIILKPAKVVSSSQWKLGVGF